MPNIILLINFIKLVLEIQQANILGLYYALHYFRCQIRIQIKIALHSIKNNAIKQNINNLKLFPN